MSRETRHQEHIGPYRLLARVAGGVGTVHRAADPDGRDVAIRLLPPGTYDIAAMRNVLSPYVVDVLDGDDAADPPYVVSRFVPGRPLDESLTGPLRGAGLRQTALGLARALAALHQAGLAHGDLRPDHILVVDGAPVVIDFGLVPGDPARDLRAWAANVAFAATADPRCLAADDPAAAAGDAVPAPLGALLRAAADPAGALTAAELAESVAALTLDTALDPGLDTGLDAAPAGPSRDAVPGAGVEEPRRPEEPEAAPQAVPQAGAGAGAGAGAAEGGRGAEPSAAAATERARAHELAVARAWARLLTVMVVVIAVGVAIAVPLAGIVLSLVSVTVLRGTSAGWAAGVARTAVTVPYAAVAAVAVTLGLAGMSVFRVEVDPLGACAFGAGAAAGVLWAAPGVTGPRRHLEEVFASVARAPRRIAVAGVVLGALALVAVVAAISLTPTLAPLYGLQSSLESGVARLQAALH
ncbi:hypothetical protein GCM10023085_78330 [Actinomadura viridis]|uniref:Protein kinase domain-containing protein n=1 Tax=Actinomadura viridis TaxID=58110 RepID=A0A931DF34_9ACTN|nr:phosphotransferase [Actinomadura viridis]MBG6087639.1 hypothetical protein [Actinomadura viridis]